MEIKNLDTERRNIKTMNLDTFSAFDICKTMNEEDQNIIQGINKSLAQITKVVQLAGETLTKQGRIIYLGAGTSGRLGLLDAVECPPTFGVAENLVKGLIAGGDKAFIKAVEGAEDSESLGIKDLKGEKITNKDLIIGIAASGRTPYVIGGLKYAKEIGAQTATIAITSNSEIAKYTNNAIEVQVGPEILTGSTRLKAGTAQKMILNMISTGAMILNGKTYQNLMVDVQQTNQKLIKRAINIVVEATNCPEQKAIEVLEQTKGSVKIAIVIILFNVDVETAKTLLEDAKGFINKINN
ncbi:MAG: N-acetylmuramic acid 6-phosphate etherase [Mycoplasmatales bacterium]